MAEQNRPRRKATAPEAPAPAVAEPKAADAIVAPVQAAAPKPAAPTKVTTTATFRRRLEQGDHGPVVAEVQRLLAAKGGWDGPLDGRYGTLLARAIRVFQGSKGLKVNGEVDVLTWEALNA
jgi:peptidoglycan hydrolase-like protein with peptidoglycan-binding domain